MAYRSRGASRHALPCTGHQHTAAQFITIETRHAPLVAADWATFSASTDRPVLYRLSDVPTRAAPRAAELIAALRHGEDSIVDVELGRYDDAADGAFQQVGMPLGGYLDWLEADRSSGLVDNKQVYLAQWPDYQKIEAVRRAVICPPALSALIEQESIDLYQTALFLGPTGAITPLHYDPYINLFHLQASSALGKYAKHVLLLPPSASPALRTAGGQQQVQRNTSNLDFRIAQEAARGAPSFRVEIPSSVASNVAEVVKNEAVTCILREGDTLYIPRGWWHRVENVDLMHGPDARGGWTAGISWWFLHRNL